MKKIFIITLMDKDTEKVKQTWRLDKQGQYVLGRSPQADIIVQSDTISRKHAVITVLQSSSTIKDLESANGTYVNDKQVKTNQIILLSDGVQIKLGQCSDILNISVQLKEEQEDQADQQEDEISNQEEVEIQQVPKEKYKSYKNTNNERERSLSKEKEKNQVQKNYFIPDVNDNKAKRAILWSNKSTEDLSQKKQIWNQIAANQDEKNRFMKLLGVKEVPKTTELIKKSAADSIDNRKVTQDLEKQYYQGVSRKGFGQNKTSGMGFKGE